MKGKYSKEKRKNERGIFPTGRKMMLHRANHRIISNNNNNNGDGHSHSSSSSGWNNNGRVVAASPVSKTPRMIQVHQQPQQLHSNNNKTETDPPSSSNNDETHYLRGIASYKEHNFEQAIVEFQQAVKVREGFYGRYSEETRWAYCYLAASYLYTNNNQTTYLSTYALESRIIMSLNPQSIGENLSLLLKKVYPQAKVIDVDDVDFDFGESEKKKKESSSSPSSTLTKEDVMLHFKDHHTSKKAGGATASDTSSSNTTTVAMSSTSRSRSRSGSSSGNNTSNLRTIPDMVVVETVLSDSEEDDDEEDGDQGNLVPLGEYTFYEEYDDDNGSDIEQNRTEEEKKKDEEQQDGGVHEPKRMDPDDIWSQLLKDDDTNDDEEALVSRKNMLKKNHRERFMKKIQDKNAVSPSTTSTTTQLKEQQQAHNENATIITHENCTRVTKKSIELESKGDFQRSNGNYQEAIAYYERAIQLESNFYGPNNATIAYLQRKIACIKLFLYVTGGKSTNMNVESATVFWKDADLLHTTTWLNYIHNHYLGRSSNCRPGGNFDDLSRVLNCIQNGDKLSSQCCYQQATGEYARASDMLSPSKQQTTTSVAMPQGPDSIPSKEISLKKRTTPHKETPTSIGSSTQDKISPPISIEQRLQEMEQRLRIAQEEQIAKMLEKYANMIGPSSGNENHIELRKLLDSLSRELEEVKTAMRSQSNAIVASNTDAKKDVLHTMLVLFVSVAIAFLLLTLSSSSSSSTSSDNDRSGPKRIITVGGSYIFRKIFNFKKC